MVYTPNHLINRCLVFRPKKSLRIKFTKKKINILVKTQTLWKIIRQYNILVFLLNLLLKKSYYYGTSNWLPIQTRTFFIFTNFRSVYKQKIMVKTE